eukprot:gene11839-10238_t
MALRLGETCDTWTCDGTKVGDLECRECVNVPNVTGVQNAPSCFNGIQDPDEERV